VGEYDRLVKIIHVTASLSRYGAGVSQAAWDLARETRAGAIAYGPASCQGHENVKYTDQLRVNPHMKKDLE